jgi:hypothetical protein
MVATTKFPKETERRRGRRKNDTTVATTNFHTAKERKKTGATVQKWHQKKLRERERERERERRSSAQLMQKAGKTKFEREKNKKEKQEQDADEAKWQQE